MLDVNIIASIRYLFLIWSFSLSVKTFQDIHISHTPYTIECLKILNFIYQLQRGTLGPKDSKYPLYIPSWLTIIHFYFSYIVKSKNWSPSYKIGLNSVHSRPIWLKLSWVTPETCFAMTQWWYLHVLQDPISMTWRMVGF